MAAIKVTAVSAAFNEAVPLGTGEKIRGLRAHIIIADEFASISPEIYETVENRLGQFVSLLQLDRNGRINVDALLEMSATQIDPIMADAFLQPAEQAQQQVVKMVTEDLSKIYAGIEVGARPNGAQIALEVVRQYVSQPDVMGRLQQDEAFRTRLDKYTAQYQFALTQQQNAEIGRLGTAPAQMGGVETQTINQ